MKLSLLAGLQEATRLTRKGSLTAAVQVIQRTLGTGVMGSKPQIDVPHSIENAEATRSSRKKTEEVTLKGARSRRKNFGAGNSRAEVPSAPIPDGAEFLTRSFSSQSGTREYKLYIPSDRDAIRGLLVMLHGCTQDADDFALGTGMNEIAQERGLLVAFPVQSRAANASRCWNWFEPKDQARDGGEPEIIASLTKSLISEFSINPSQVFVAGLSAGGAMADILGATYPEIYSAVGVHSGLPSGSATNLVSALSAMKGTNGRSAGRRAHGNPTPRVIVFHGTADRTVAPANGNEIVDHALEDTEWSQQHTVEGRSSGGIEYTLRVANDTDGIPLVEHWTVHDIAHAWSGGSKAGTYTDSRGPNASREMVRFFLKELP